MAKFHLIPIVLGAAIGVGVYVVSKYLAQDEEIPSLSDGQMHLTAWIPVPIQR